MQSEIMHDIRDMQYLSKEKLEKIKHMSDETKMEIITVYNEIVLRLLELLDLVYEETEEKEKGCEPPHFFFKTT